MVSRICQAAGGFKHICIFLKRLEPLTFNVPDWNPGVVGFPTGSCHG